MIETLMHIDKSHLLLLLSILVALAMYATMGVAGFNANNRQDSKDKVVNIDSKRRRR